MSESTSTSRRSHPCNQCNKSFSSVHQLAQHSRVHTGEKPYKCSFCDRHFKQLSHVQQHTRLHTGERPYKCPNEGCGRSFIQLSNLQQHMRTHKTYIDKRHSCGHCGKLFKSRSQLITHQHKHTVLQVENDVEVKSEPEILDIAYYCEPCDKTFVNETSFRRHHGESHQSSSSNISESISNTPPSTMGSHRTTISQSSINPPSASTPIQLWTCSFCATVFSHEFGLLAHMENMKSDPLHQSQQLNNCNMQQDKKMHVMDIASFLHLNGNISEQNILQASQSNSSRANVRSGSNLIIANR